MPTVIENNYQNDDSKSESKRSLISNQPEQLQINKENNNSILKNMDMEIINYSEQQIEKSINGDLNENLILLLNNQINNDNNNILSITDTNDIHSTSSSSVSSDLSSSVANETSNNGEKEKEQLESVIDEKYQIEDEPVYQDIDNFNYVNDKNEQIINFEHIDPEKQSQTSEQSHENFNSDSLDLKSERYFFQSIL
jgi:hypothetical protein